MLILLIKLLDDNNKETILKDLEEVCRATRHMMDEWRVTLFSLVSDLEFIYRVYP